MLSGRSSDFVLDDTAWFVANDGKKSLFRIVLNLKQPPPRFLFLSEQGGLLLLLGLASANIDDGQVNIFEKLGVLPDAIPVL